MNKKWSGLSDGELVLAAQNQSLEAYEALVLRYEQRIFRFVAMNCASEADAREITQDTFLAAFQAIRQFKTGLSVGPWLFAIARRKQIDWLRAVQRRNSVEINEADLTTEENPADQLAAREAGQRVWDVAKSSLSPVLFGVLWLKYVEGMSVSEIAGSVQKSVPHVKILLFRARREMSRALLAEDLNQDLLTHAQRFGKRISGVAGEAI